MRLRILVKAIKGNYEYQVITCNLDGSKSGTYKIDKIGSRETEIRSREGNYFELLQNGNSKLIQKEEARELIDSFNNTRREKGYKNFIKLLQF